MAITVQQSNKPPTPLRGLRALSGSLFSRLFGAEVARRVQLAVQALDDTRDAIISGQSQLERDRFTADREEILRDALLAWRTNPLAKRIVSLTTQYVIGEGIKLEARHEPTDTFLKSWWHHRLNRMPVRIVEWCDELTRSGNLIVLVSTDATGMSYVRALPATQVQTIITRPNDVEQPLAIVEKMQWGASLVASGVGVANQPLFNAGAAPYVGVDPTYGVATTPPDILPAPDHHPSPDTIQPTLDRHSSPGTGAPGRGPWTWPAYDQATDAQNPDGTFPTVAIHYAINRPVAAAWGESDLAPLLRWLARYSNWLEDRARLNRFRQAFMYVVSAAFQSKADRLARQAEINANPPTPGAVLVKDEAETWEVLEPRLASSDAGEDGLALKKMISAGSGNPLHFLAEPESATRTTAEAAGGPTFRHYEQRQNYFLWLLDDLTHVALARRALVDKTVHADEPVKLTGSDISARDNASLAQAASFIANSFTNLRDRQIIDDAELLRLVYRFCGENVDVEAMLKRGAAALPQHVPVQPPDPNAPKPPGDRTISPD